MNDTIDFSPKANILLEDEHGQRTPMSEPYYRAEPIAPGTWRILSDGDYSYLLEGEDGSALLIDTGYGAGNIRKYCEALTGRSVPWVVCTHHHFDHTALCGYFDLAFMAAESVPLATIPYPSFEGVDFPRNYAVQIVEDGDTVPLPGRELLVFKLPDHAPGSIALLDRKGRILFGGDEFGMDFGKPLSGSVAHWARLMERLAPYRGDYDAVWCGPGRADDDIVQRLLDNCRAVLAGAEGEPWTPPPFHAWQTTDEQGRTVWKRRLPHPGDGPKEEQGESAFKRRYGVPPAAIVYDIRRIHETPAKRKEGSSMSKVIDANLYWFPEALFTDEALSERFLSEIPAQYGIRGSFKASPETGLRQYVIEKPVGSENLNYVQGDYVLEKQLADMDRAGVDKAVLKLSCQQEWMGLDMCRLFNDGMAAHVKASGGRMHGLRMNGVQDIGEKSVVIRAAPALARQADLFWVLL